MTQGLDIDGSGNLYIADGQRIRKVSNSTGIIETIAGSLKVSPWIPHDYLCQFNASTTLQWPTYLSLNPLDGSLSVLDGDEILTLTNDNLINKQGCHKR